MGGESAWDKPKSHLASQAEEQNLELGNQGGRVLGDRICGQ